MRRSRRPIVIGSRKSRLARAQAQLVGKALARLHRHLRVEYRWIESTGDRTPGTLAGHGGKGLFTRTIEEALLTHDVDLAVHSLKDLPTAQTPGLTLAAIPRRGEFRDCLVTADGVNTLEGLAPHAVVGSSSPRRAAQVKRFRSDLQVMALRGNVETRLNAVLGPLHEPEAPKDGTPDHGREVDAVMLSAAGLRRLGYKGYAKAVMDPQTILPAACQGAIAVQCRADDHVSLTRTLPLNDATTATAVHAERAVVAGLGATCGSPVAVLAKTDSSNTHSQHLTLQARVLSADGQHCPETHEQGPPQSLPRMIERTIADLQTQGAAALLANP